MIPCRAAQGQAFRGSLNTILDHAGPPMCPQEKGRQINAIRSRVVHSLQSALRAKYYQIRACLAYFAAKGRAFSLQSRLAGGGRGIRTRTTTCSGHFTLPQGWTGNMDVRIYWFANASSGNAVRWSVQTGCVGDAAAVSTGPSYNAASGSNTAYTGTANQRKTTALTALAMTNCSAGNEMWFQLSRSIGKTKIHSEPLNCL